jgi:hypothetical protein
LGFATFFPPSPIQIGYGGAGRKVAKKKNPDNPACRANLSRRSFNEGGSYSEGG